MLSGIKEIKAVMAEAERARRLGRRTLLFIDEIHRFNKAQQDAFLPYVERGDIILIGATTENPSFEVISALLSRARSTRCAPLTVEEIASCCWNAPLPRARERRAGSRRCWSRSRSTPAATPAPPTTSWNRRRPPSGGVTRAQAVEDAMQRKMLLYDKGGEEHYNLISALHKCVRSSDPDAALYWLARMLEAGEDRMYIARRLVRMAIEDIGLADPRALEQAIACMQTVHFLGIPEGDQALAQAAIYLAVAPKSDAAYQALNQAAQDVVQDAARRTRVPMHLRNAPTRAMKEWGYGDGYQHAHQFSQDALTGMECLPESLAGTRFYEPSDRGIEARITERLDAIRKWIAEKRRYFFFQAVTVISMRAAPTSLTPPTVVRAGRGSGK